MRHHTFRAALVALACLAPVSAAHAEDPKPVEPGPWKFGELVSLNLSQSTFSDNWSGGDRGSIVWVIGSASTAERQFTKRFNSSTALTLAYGESEQQVIDPANPSHRVWDSPDKSTDQILLESVGRFTLDGWADPYVAFRGESQFRDQSNPLGTLTLNPVKLKETAGAARVLVKTDERMAITRVGFGVRQVFGHTLLSAAPWTTSGYTANDGGFEWQTDVKQPILQKKVLYTGSLLVFEPLFYSGANKLKQLDADAKAADIAHEAVADFWRAPNVTFQNTFSAQVTKSISVNLYAQWVYDKLDGAVNVDPSRTVQQRLDEVDRNTRKAGQFKETLALGIGYRLF